MAMKNCPQCGKLLRDEKVKCSYCGEMVEHISQPQRGKQHWDIIAILVIITICVIAFLNSKNKHDEKEVSYIGENAQKENVTGQASEKNITYSGNYDNKARVNDTEQRRINMQQHEKIINNMRQQQIQVQNQMEQRQKDMEQQRKQQLVDNEIKQYEREQQQNKINESNGKKIYQRNRIIYFESVTSK